MYIYGGGVPLSIRPRTCAAWGSPQVVGGVLLYVSSTPIVYLYTGYTIHVPLGTYIQRGDPPLYIYMGGVHPYWYIVIHWAMQITTYSQHVM